MRLMSLDFLFTLGLCGLSLFWEFLLKLNPIKFIDLNCQKNSFFHSFFNFPSSSLCRWTMQCHRTSPVADHLGPSMLRTFKRSWGAQDYGGPKCLDVALLFNGVVSDGLQQGVGKCLRSALILNLNRLLALESRLRQNRNVSTRSGSA